MASLFKNLFKKDKRQPIIIVSGLPRSGTSLMMQLIDKGGIPVVTDNMRIADVSNPKGYYELETVKRMETGDTKWLTTAHGQVVKVISALVHHLPNQHNYKLIFMRRNLDEIYASQMKMLENDAKIPQDISKEQLLETYQVHLKRVYDWVNRQKNISMLEINYNTLMESPEHAINQVVKFIDLDMDKEQMLSVIDPALYRNRVSRYE